MSAEDGIKAPPAIQEKLRKLDLTAGAPRKKTGPVKGQPSKGGRPARNAQRRADWDAAKLAQMQYEEMKRLWRECNPVRNRDRSDGQRAGRVSKRRNEPLKEV